MGQVVVKKLLAGVCLSVISACHSALTPGWQLVELWGCKGGSDAPAKKTTHCRRASTGVSLHPPRPWSIEHDTTSTAAQDVDLTPRRHSWLHPWILLPDVGHRQVAPYNSRARARAKSRDDNANSNSSPAASGLYYLSELVEEHTVVSKRLLTQLIYIIVGIQLLLCFVDRFPFWLTVLGIASHVVYLGNMRRFPVVTLTDPLFITSCSKSFVLSQSLSPRHSGSHG